MCYNNRYSLKKTIKIVTISPLTHPDFFSSSSSPCLRTIRSLRWDLKPSLPTLVVAHEVSKTIGAWKHQGPRIEGRVCEGRESDVVSTFVMSYIRIMRRAILPPHEMSFARCTVEAQQTGAVHDHTPGFYFFSFVSISFPSESNVVLLR